MDRAEEREFSMDGGDDELIRRAGEGDLRAFDVLVRRYQRKVYYLALRMLKSHDAADDVAQDTFVRAYRAIGTFKPGSNFYTWLYRICMNRSLNYLEKEKHLVPESAFGEGSSPLERASTEADPLDEVAGAESAQLIEKAIDSLSPAYKAVFILRVYEEMTYEEIAESLGISMGTVMSRLFRAREKLQEMLSGHDTETR
jgi:RNA polymerase sigma-70 factor (ECF subfamily)